MLLTPNPALASPSLQCLIAEADHHASDRYGAAKVILHNMTLAPGAEPRCTAHLLDRSSWRASQARELFVSSNITVSIRVEHLYC